MGAGGPKLTIRTVRGGLPGINALHSDVTNDGGPMSSWLGSELIHNDRGLHAILRRCVYQWTQPQTLTGLESKLSHPWPSLLPPVRFQVSGGNRRIVIHVVAKGATSGSYAYLWAATSRHQGLPPRLERAWRITGTGSTATYTTATRLVRNANTGDIEAAGAGSIVVPTRGYGEEELSLWFKPGEITGSGIPYTSTLAAEVFNIGQGNFGSVSLKVAADEHPITNINNEGKATGAGAEAAGTGYEAALYDNDESIYLTGWRPIVWADQQDECIVWPGWNPMPRAGHMDGTWRIKIRPTSIWQPWTVNAYEIELSGSLDEAVGL